MIFELSYFPKNIFELILNFLPYNVKYLLNKTYYKKYHKFASFFRGDGYIKFVIRNDMTFIFNELLNTNIEKWEKKKKIMYKNKKYMSFIKYINQLLIEYKSNKCRNILYNR
tara:strand:- start:247 stop:582 length:336 start_codon:yes stop_codon:yes gene_type:complete